MLQVAIRCHPLLPVDVGELEQWLEDQVEDLRAGAPQGTIRLSRLTQNLPTSEMAPGCRLRVGRPRRRRRGMSTHAGPA